MTAVETELNAQFISTDWNSNSSMAIVRSIAPIEGHSTIELNRFLRPNLPVETPLTGTVLTTASAKYVGGSPLMRFQANRRIIAGSSSNESITDSLFAATPDVVKAFFLPAESQLSAKTEITAQYGLKLLRRIRELVVKISPSDLQGKILVLVDEEDGSTTIEWIRKRSRLGFVLDRENQSSWFVVLPNGLSNSGYLYRDSGLKSLRGLLEEFTAAGE